MPRGNSRGRFPRGRTPMKRDDRTQESNTFINGLFRPPSTQATMVSASDPFLSSESLREYCGLWSQDKSGLPKYIADDPQIADICNFSDEWYHDVAKIQIERENKEKKTEEAASKIVQDQEDQEQAIKQTLDIQIDNIMTQQRHFLKKQCPVMLPHKSCLDHDEHRAYIRAFLKFEKIRPAKTPAEHQEYKNYQCLQNRVYSEQSLFMQTSYQIAKSQLSSYNTVPEIISCYVDNHVKHRCQRRLKYEGKYVDEQQIPLKPQDPKNKFINLEFTHKGHLLSLGSVPWFQLPDPLNQNTVPLNENVDRFRPTDIDGKYSTERVLYKTPVSEDPNASFLAHHHKAKIVISSSTLKTLVDNSAPHYGKEWDIPVRIRTYTSKDESGNEVSQRVVFLDKPMPKKLWTPLEKKQLFFKKACLTKMTRLHHDPFFRLKSPAMFHYNNPELFKKSDMSSNHKGAEPASYDDDMFNLYENAEVDTFGGDYNKEKLISPRKRRKNYTKKKDENNETGNTDPATSLKDNGETDTNSETKENSRVKSGNDECSMSNASQDEMVIDEAKESVSELVNQKGQSKENIHEGPVNESRKVDEKCNLSQEKEKELDLNQVNKGPLNENNFENSKTKDLKNTKGVKRKADNENMNEFPANQTKSQQPNSGLDTKISTQIDNKSEAKNNAKNMIDNLLDMQDTLFKHQKSNQNPSEAATTDPDTAGPKLNPKPWSNTIPTAWEEFTDPLNSPNRSGVNVHYQMFTFGFGSNDKLANLHPEMNVIVRHNIHGHSRFRKRQISPPTFPYLVFPKPENQAFFGCEVSTISEITQQWIKLLVRPNVRLLEVRMCEKDGDILMSQDRSINEVMKEAKQPHINFHPHQCLATLYSVFSALNSQPTGDYLLHHDAKTGAHIRLMKATEPSQVTHQAVYDLHAAYEPQDKVLTRSYAEPPWLAIDTHILTPFHLKHAKIPGTFPMSNPKEKLSKQQKKKKKQKYESANKIAYDDIKDL